MGKIGDRVRFLENIYGFEVGTEGTLTSYWLCEDKPENVDFPYNITPDGEDEEYLVSRDEFEVITNG